MYSGKKGVASYVVVLAIVSLIVSFLLMFLLDSIWGRDHQDCKNIDFEVKNACSSGKKVEFKINNKNSQEDVEFKINGRRNVEDFRVKAAGEKKMIVSTESRIVEVLPILKRDRIYECNGKVYNLNTEVLIRC